MRDSDKLAIQNTPDGAALPVKVVPGSSRDKIAGVLGEALKVATSAPPERGKANQAVAAILAKALDVDTRNIQLQSGTTSPHKVFLFVGTAASELRQRIAEI